MIYSFTSDTCVNNQAELDQLLKSYPGITAKVNVWNGPGGGWPEISYFADNKLSLFDFFMKAGFTTLPDQAPMSEHAKEFEFYSDDLSDDFVAITVDENEALIEADSKDEAIKILQQAIKRLQS